MSSIPTSCPACEGPLEVTRLTCPACAMQLEGRFEFPELMRLDKEDLRFVLDFVRCSGSLKELGKIRGQSYPTVRNRLNEIIERLSAGERDVERRRREILDALSKGELSVKEASRRLKELES